MKVALIHEHLAQDGGAEKVLKVLSEMFPHAPIYTLLYDKKHIEKHFPGKDVQTSIIQKLPGGVRHYQWYMPFMPMAVEFFDLRTYDVVISSSSAFSKGVITSADTLHISYCHSPTRYLWDYAHQYIQELRYNKYFKKIISLSLNKIRIWDRAAADRVDKFIANSQTVKNRIAKYYRRDSVIIYPPVETDKFFIDPNVEDYFLIGCRLAPYKRVDIVIEAFIRAGFKLKIFGTGVDLKRLKEQAKEHPNIEFLGRVSDEEKYALISKCQAFIYPQEEDFGITAVESMAAGRPVIAYKKGGATETIIDGKTGLFFEEQSPASLLNALERFRSMQFSPEQIKTHAQQYSTSRFKKEILDFIEKEYIDFKNNLQKS